MPAVFDRCQTPAVARVLSCEWNHRQPVHTELNCVTACAVDVCAGGSRRVPFSGHSFCRPARNRVRSYRPEQSSGCNDFRCSHRRNKRSSHLYDAPGWACLLGGPGNWCIHHRRLDRNHHLLAGRNPARKIRFQSISIKSSKLSNHRHYAGGYLMAWMCFHPYTSRTMKILISAPYLACLLDLPI